MNGHQFTFPPPPPAPPKASQKYPGVSQPFAGPVGYSDSRNRGSNNNRGYGSDRNQDWRRGGRFGSSQSTSSHSNSNWGLNNKHSSPPAIGYNVQTNNDRRSGYPLPSYPSVLLPQYPTNPDQGYGQQTAAFPTRPSETAFPINGHGSPYSSNGQQEYPSLGHRSSLHTMPSPLATAVNNNSNPTNAHTGQPVLMGPPIRMGFDAQRNVPQKRQFAQPIANGTNGYHHGLLNGNDSQYGRSSPVGFPSGLHESLNSFPGHRGRGRKRGHGEAFNRTRNQNRHTPVAPAVPSFGGPVPLPVKPPALHETTRKPRKKKHKHNQLGLTPKVEEHESSEEEEDDVDEEAKLASAAASTSRGPQLLQFDYKGHTSTLQSASDIAAWIEQRKKRFPTKARGAEIAAGKRQLEEQQRATNQTRREFQEKRRSEVRKRQNLKTKGEKQRKKGEGKTTSEDTAARSKRKVEKLRRQLEREEQRIAKAEGKAFKEREEPYSEVGRTDVSMLGKGNKKRKRSDSGGSGDVKVEDIDLVKTEFQEAARIVPDPLTPTSQPALADEGGDPPIKAPNANGAPVQVYLSTGQQGDRLSIPDMDRSIEASSVSLSDLSSVSFSTDSENNTSSRGSPSEDDGDDEAPDETSTKCNGPERIPPPKRAKRKQICRAFLHKGFCKRGSRCKYLHEVPERGSRGVGSQEVRSSGERKGRVGLYQRLVEQEKEREDLEAKGAMLHLGEEGLLDKGVQGVIREAKSNSKATG